MAGNTRHSPSDLESGLEGGRGVSGGLEMQEKIYGGNPTINTPLANQVTSHQKTEAKETGGKAGFPNTGIKENNVNKVHMDQEQQSTLTQQNIKRGGRPRFILT